MEEKRRITVNRIIVFDSLYIGPVIMFTFLKDKLSAELEKKRESKIQNRNNLLMKTSASVTCHSSVWFLTITFQFTCFIALLMICN